MIIVWLGLGWLICAILSHGVAYSTMQRQFPNRSCKSNLIVSIFISLIGGPAALISVYITNAIFDYECGFKLW